MGEPSSANRHVGDMPMRSAGCGVEAGKGRGNTVRLPTRKMLLRESGPVWLLVVYYRPIGLSHG